ncbi:MAG TPA: hypothetical protein VGD63_12705, partial [Steroidobacteraceae bacterium]
HFMIAHLQNGRYGSTQILRPDTAAQMHGSALTILPRVNRMLLGFYENNYNGHRVISHGGDTQWFHSELNLFIDDGVGLLVSMNSTGKDGAAQGIRSTLFHEFADRYLPAPAYNGNVNEKTAAEQKTAAEHAAMIAGHYIGSRRFDSSFMSLLNVISEAKVIDNGDGTIGVSSIVSPSGVPERWREIAPFIWREENGKDLLAARVEGGKVVRFSFDEVSPFQMYDRPAPSKSGAWWLPVLAASVSVLLLGSLAWPAGALARRRFKASYALSGLNAKAHRAVRIASLAAVLVFLGWATVIIAMTTALDLISKMNGWIVLLRILSPIVFLGAAAVGLWNAGVVLRSSRAWFVKLWAILLAASLLALLGAALTFHLISFRMGF